MSDADPSLVADTAKLNAQIAVGQQSRANYYADIGVANPETAGPAAVGTTNPQTGQPTVTTPPAKTAGGQPDGELLIKAGGQIYGGWTTLAVTAGVERIPTSFTIVGTPKFPGEMRSPIALNAAVTILIGGRVVLTGYLERGTVSVGPDRHEQTLVGRGRCCDLVDCAAILQGMSLQGASVGELARQLVKPFAGPIQVLTPDGDGDKKNYIFNINLGESPYEILERVARYEGLLVYENAAGNLVLSRVGKVKHSSGFTEGQNVQEIERFDSRDERFSTYIPQLMSADTMGQVGAGGNAAGDPVADPGITRYRPRIVISEQANESGLLAQQRATFEALRRVGQSLRVELTCDSWLDSAGTPWTPNQLAPVSMPSLGLNEPGLVITEVSFKRDGKAGTTARLVLMPPEALTIEPSALQAFSAQLASGQKGSSANSPLGTPTPTVAPLSAANAGANRNVRAGEGAGL